VDFRRIEFDNGTIVVSIPIIKEEIDEFKKGIMQIAEKGKKVVVNASKTPDEILEEITRDMTPEIQKLISFFEFEVRKIIIEN